MANKIVFPVVSGKEYSCQCRIHEFHPWVWKIPWRRKWQPTTVFLPGKSPGQRSLAGYSSWGPKESDTTEQLTFIHMESPALLQEFAQDHNRERFLFLWSEITRYPRADIVPETKQAFRN